jgi:hypothetical protein
MSIRPHPVSGGQHDQPASDSAAVMPEPYVVRQYELRRSRASNPSSTGERSGDACGTPWRGTEVGGAGRAVAGPGSRGSAVQVRVDAGRDEPSDDRAEQDGHRGTDGRHVALNRRRMARRGRTKGDRAGEAAGAVPGCGHSGVLSARRFSYSP